MTKITWAGTVVAAVIVMGPGAVLAQDCSGFLGNFRGADNVVFAITDAGDGSLIITHPDGATATAACLPPLVTDSGEYPQAQATGMGSLGDVAFEDPACCVMTSNGNQINFSTTGRYWQRQPG
jgi:hypothetical protein